ncbi:MAG TPA: hypothetical protein VF278_02585 [Pirellulales bacterium]
MNDESRLEELLDEWEEACQQGVEPAPETHKGVRNRFYERYLTPCLPTLFAPLFALFCPPTLAEEDVTSPTQQGTTTWPELDAQGSVIDMNRK